MGQIAALSRHLVSRQYHMKNILIVFAFLFSSVQAEDKVFVVVNGTPITETEVMAFNALQANQSAMQSPQEKIALLNQLINTVLLAQEGEKKGLDQDPLVQAALKMARTQIIAEAMINDYLENHPIGEEEIKQAYEQIFSQDRLQEYKVKHILVNDRQEAEEIIALLKKGQDFAELAKARSVDPSKDAGGDLGWLSRNQVVKGFGDAMVKLKKGEYSQEPVQTQFGWHIILVEDQRQQTPPPLDEVKEQIKLQLQQQKLAMLIDKLRSEVKLEVPDVKPAEDQQPAAEK